MSSPLIRDFTFRKYFGTVLVLDLLLWFRFGNDLRLSLALCLRLVFAVCGLEEDRCGFAYFKHGATFRLCDFRKSDRDWTPLVLACDDSVHRVNDFDRFLFFDPLLAFDD